MGTLSDYVGSGFCEVTSNPSARRHYGPLIDRFDEFDIGGLESRAQLIENLWGWWAIDPTNAPPVGERHVKIDHGRDYDDVTPLRGVYYGESDHHLAAEVTMSTSRIVSTAVPEWTWLH